MNESDRICIKCEFYEAHYDRANSGICFLDIHGDHGVKTVKANENCQFWMGSTVSQSEDWQ